jgi:hypothetical protein
MTKKLEDLFDLADPVEAEKFYKTRKLKEDKPTLEPEKEIPVATKMPMSAPIIDSSKLPKEDIPVATTSISTAVDMGDRINTALPLVHDTQTTDPDMDRYADKAEKAFEDLMDLGFNVEDRNAGHVFSAAKDMLKNAIELQLKKMRLDQNTHKEPKVIESSDFIVSDRNSMLSALSQNNDK